MGRRRHDHEEWLRSVSVDGLRPEDYIDETEDWGDEKEEEPMQRVWLTQPHDCPSDKGIVIPSKEHTGDVPETWTLYAMRGWSCYLAIYDVAKARFVGFYLLPRGEAVSDWLRDGRAQQRMKPWTQ